jgi:cytochrome c-type biogenesis protein CcmH
MSPEDRQGMIRGMVERLAARLRDNPDDVEGWQRLARAYDVLGESDKAAEARSHLAKAGAPAAAAPSAPPAAATSPGPTAADMQAAASMTPEARQQMIHGMVDGLAAKLEKNPNDVPGWLRLARAYRVLGDGEKSKAALARAHALAPQNPDVLLDEANAMLEESGESDDPTKPLPPAFLSLMQQVQQLDPDAPEPLWYLGLAAAQRRVPDEARQYWTRLIAGLPAGSEQYKTVRAALDALPPAGKP